MDTTRLPGVGSDSWWREPQRRVADLAGQVALMQRGRTGGGGGYITVDAALGDGTTDATAGIQNTLNRAIGGTIVIPPGNYIITSPLTLPANLVVLGYGATLHRAGPNGMIMINWEPGDTTGWEYFGPSNITVQGVTFDSHAGDNSWPYADEFGTPYADLPSQPVTFAHCTNITVRDCRFLRTHTLHALEFNAVDGGLADNCTFEGWEPGESTTREAIQIDCASPGFGAADDTMSRNITVRGCRFTGYQFLGAHATAVGSHTLPAGGMYSSIHVAGCHIDSPSFAGVRAHGWVDSTIEGNTIGGFDWSAGVILDSGTTRTVVANNLIDGEYQSSTSGNAVMADTGTSRLVITGNNVQNAQDGILVDGDHIVATGNVVSSTNRYSFSVGGSHNLIANNILRRTNGSSVVRFYTGSAVGNSVTGNQYRPDGDSAGTYAVSIASGQSVWVYGNDFLGAAALTSGTVNTTGNRI